jgi:hypothetical protein
MSEPLGIGGTLFPSVSREPGGLGSRDLPVGGGEVCERDVLRTYAQLASGAVPRLKGVPSAPSPSC